MARRKKKGNYTIDDRKLIMMAATSSIAGQTVGEKQAWLQRQGVHRPGVPTDPVSASAIKYWEAVERRFKGACSEDQYTQLLEYLFRSPKSYRTLKTLEPQEILQESLS
jgi:hypothetical protein